MLACGGALEQIPIKCRLLYHNGMSGISLQPLLLQVAVVSDHARDRWFAIGGKREFIEGEKNRNSGEGDPKATLVVETSDVSSVLIHSGVRGDELTPRGSLTEWAGGGWWAE